MMPPANINTTDYWDTVYRREWESGQARGDAYSRDYSPIHDAIIALVPNGGRVLDIACGPGLLCRKIKERRPATCVLGVDFSQYMIRRIQERDQPLGVEYRCLDIRSALPALERDFDVVSMCEVLEHLDEPEAVLASALERLRPGGLFVLTCPHDEGIPDPEHVRLWGHDDLFHVLAPYSNTVSFMHFAPPYFHVWMLAYLTKNASRIQTERSR